MKPVIHHWPDLPPLPPPPQPVLVRVSTTPDRRLARQESRAVLRKILAAWSDCPADRLPLMESPHGPGWPGELRGASLDISLSYTENESWLALLRGGCVGVDAMKLLPLPELAGVARNYFDPATTALIGRSANPLRVFVEAWTTLEARLKCLKLGLVEWSSARDAFLAGCASQTQNQFDDVVIAVAIVPTPISPSSFHF
jgi:phosphopantetheinyl transferase